ncbi:MAG TPA: hypothetical protein VD905_08075 [Flavobacteriales bacterium]|nr:hypothetical protein [Flavobacteriales bacterium]
MNAELLDILNRISVYWNHTENRREPLAQLSHYIQHAVDFTNEITEIIELANDENGNEDPFSDLVVALQYNYTENKTHLLFIFNYLATRAVTVNNYYSYFLFNHVQYEEFVNEIPEIATEIIPLLVPLLKSNFNLNKEFAIKTGQYCLWANPKADRNNYIFTVQEALKDPDWKIRHYAFKCLKKTNNLPVGFKRSVTDFIRPLIFHKQIQ